MEARAAGAVVLRHPFNLGYGVARGAEMLSLMLACGIVSRLVSGVICDHIGGLRTLVLGSVLQGLALLLFLPFDGLASLYVVSALFGLFQGGIVPSYAIIVREHFPPAEAGARVGTVRNMPVHRLPLFRCRPRPYRLPCRPRLPRFVGSLVAGCAGF